MPPANTASAMKQLISCTSNDVNFVPYSFLSRILLMFSKHSFDDLLIDLIPYYGPKRRRTVFVTTNIGIAREFMRHRSASFTERSTRYTKKQELNPTMEHEELSHVFQVAEREFDRMVFDRMASRDEAREVWPLGTNTCFYMTDWIENYDHMLGLRLAKAAHPSAREVARTICQVLHGSDSLPKE